MVRASSAPPSQVTLRFDGWTSSWRKSAISTKANEGNEGRKISGRIAEIQSKRLHLRSLRFLLLN
jgi:hypothetical protein